MLLSEQCSSNGGTPWAGMGEGAIFLVPLICKGRFEGKGLGRETSQASESCSVQERVALISFCLLEFGVLLIPSSPVLGPACTGACAHLALNSV